jgi:hypothetical protein
VTTALENYRCAIRTMLRSARCLSMVTERGVTSKSGRKMVSLAIITPRIAAFIRCSRFTENSLPKIVIGTVRLAVRYWSLDFGTFGGRALRYRPSLVSGFLEGRELLAIIGLLIADESLAASRLLTGRAFRTTIRFGS